MKLAKFFASLFLVSAFSAEVQAREFTIYAFIPWQKHMENGNVSAEPKLDDYLKTLGLHKVKVVYQKDFFTDEMPDENKIKKVAELAQAEDELISFDNEFGNRFKPETVLPRTRAILTMYHKYGSLPVGVYATLPLETYVWEPEKPNKLDNIRKLNAQYSSIENTVDFLSPVLYNWTKHNFDDWRNVAKFDIGEAKKYSNKPIIPYVSPYVEIGRTDFPKNGYVIEELSEEEMRQRLTVLYNQGAAGCIVWASSQVVDSGNHFPIFDASKGWGKALIDFARSHQ